MKSQHAKMGKVSSIPPQGHPSNAGRQSIEKKKKTGHTTLLEENTT